MGRRGELSKTNFVAGEETRTDSKDWLVILRPDGVVDAVSGGVPMTWLGHRLDAAPDVPFEVRTIARDVVANGRHTGCVRRTRFRIEIAGKNREIELLVVDALPLRITHTRVSELVMQTLEVFAAQARSCDVDLTVEHGKDVPPVLVCDGQKIAWALATVVGNALRFAQKGVGKGHVGVRVEWDADKEELVMKIADNGPGMPPHRAKWLFERDPSNGQSAGLALVMVRDVIAAHRGSIAVESSIGHGTTITLRLPRRLPP